MADKLYEKRKTAALEVEQVTRAILKDGDRANLDALISTLVNDFVAAPTPNHRKGGLIGLAAVTVALAGAADPNLHDIVPPVLRCFTDADQRVRYYACEALYNIAKAQRGVFVAHFAVTFDALCKLSADADPNVQNAAHLLDRLVKDIVTESVEGFDVATFAPMLKERIGVLNPYVRQFLVGWIAALDSVPEIDMLTHLPDMADGLLNMLSDPNREIRQQADGALGDFLAEIKGEGKSAHGNADLGALVDILVERCRGSADEFTRVTCINWLREFVSLAGDSPRLVPHFASIIGAVLPCMSRTESKVRETSSRASDELLAKAVERVREIRVVGEIEPSGGLDLPGVLAALTGHVGSGAKGPMRLEALRWYAALCDGSPETVRRLSLDGAAENGALDELLDSLRHESDEVVTRAMRVVGSLGNGEEADFDGVVRRVVGMFAGEGGGDVLERRGSAVVRTLCAELGAERVYCKIAAIVCEGGVAGDGDEFGGLDFAAAMVEAMNLILLTAPECAGMRKSLSGSSVGDSREPVKKRGQTGGDGVELFLALYPCWCHSAVSTVALCLLSRAYTHALRVVRSMGDAESEVTVRTLVQIDQLVHLLESPMFANLRLRLLEPNAHPDLVRGLYALLMLLPQSDAFRTLHARLSAVPTLALSRLGVNDGIDGAGGDASGGTGGCLDGGGVDLTKLAATYAEVRGRHVRAAEERRIRATRERE